MRRDEIGKCFCSVAVSSRVKLGDALSMKSESDRLPSLAPVDPEDWDLPWAASNSKNWEETGGRAFQRFPSSSEG